MSNLEENKDDTDDTLASERKKEAHEFKKKMLDILMEEYKTLRQESLGTIRLRIQIISFGLAIVILLFGVPFATKLSINIVALNFLYSVIIPLICTIIVDLWLGELYRMDRAGNFMYIQEIRLNETIKESGLLNESNKHLLSWEGYLRKKVNTKEMWPLSIYNPEKIDEINQILVIDKEKIKIDTAYEKSITLFYFIAYGSCFLSIILPPLLAILNTERNYNYFDNYFGWIYYLFAILSTILILILICKKHQNVIEKYRVIRKIRKDDIKLKNLIRLATQFYNSYRNKNFGEIKNSIKQTLIELAIEKPEPPK